MAKEFQRYNRKLGTTICQHFLDGKTWEDIAKLRGMPKAKIMRKWLEEGKNPEFRAQWVQTLRNKAQEANQEMAYLTSPKNKLTLKNLKKEYPDYNEVEIRAQLAADQKARALRIDVLKMDQKMACKLIPELADRATIESKVKIELGARIGTQILLVDYANAELPNTVEKGIVIDQG